MSLKYQTFGLLKKHILTMRLEAARQLNKRKLCPLTPFNCSQLLNGITLSTNNCSPLLMGIYNGDGGNMEKGVGVKLENTCRLHSY